ncbi:hypothetical protein ARV1_gp04 [Acidianus rod-shaped virus 1]|uniref:Uncharacterized protein n=1 Tax=Acidianus rod-shaped virus 1 TaxID=309181 RepID=Q50I67_9VIRU|nr:hypothetical protein ARV1_gp04 [Acidianus rod-shaped virus 1]CAI44159.1 hypothetical protein [Acidianus rod-shaped virus 1]
MWIGSNFYAGKKFKGERNSDCRLDCSSWVARYSNTESFIDEKDNSSMIKNG